MQVHRDINSLPSFTNAVITIGTFDGVHTGHAQIIHQLKKEAEEIHGETVIITFDPHPRLIIDSKEPQAPQKELYLLNTLDEKIRLMEEQGVDHLVIVPFTLAFSEITAEQYIRDFLVTTFHPHTIIIGYDHHFGKQRKGNYKMLEAYATEFNYRVKEIPEHVLHHVAISSTRIRQALLACDLDTANEFLGYDYFFEGEVIAGDKIGRTLGYPTANLHIKEPHKLVPGNGIYAVEAHLAGQLASIEETANVVDTNAPIALLKGMMSIGIRPTVGGTSRVIEVNLFEFDEEIYGSTLTVYLRKYLRQEEKFDSLEALTIQIGKDKAETMRVLSEDK